MRSPFRALVAPRPPLRLGFRPGCCALLLAILAAGVQSAAAGEIIVGISAFESGLPSERAVLAGEFDEPDPVEIEITPGLQFEFRPIVGPPAGVGSLQEALARQVPQAPPVVVDPAGFADTPSFNFEILDEAPDPGAQVFVDSLLAGIDLFGVLADRDPALTLNVGYEIPAELPGPFLQFQHQLFTEIVPLDGATRTIGVLGLLLEDGDGDGEAVAQATHVSVLSGVPGALPGGTLILEEPGFDVVFFEGGPVDPAGGMPIEAMMMDVSLLASVGDRVSVFSGLFVVPEPALPSLFALGLGGLLLAPRWRA